MNEIFATLNSIGKKSRNISRTDFIVASNFKETGLQKFETELTKMFDGLKDSLQTMTLNNRNDSTYGNAVLRALSKGCPTLSNLSIFVGDVFQVKNNDTFHICQQFKKLRKCQITYEPRSNEALQHYLEWKKIFDEKIQDSGNSWKMSIQCNKVNGFNF